jgi:hypothetical protein
MLKKLHDLDDPCEISNADETGQGQDYDAQVVALYHRSECLKPPPILT